VCVVVYASNSLVYSDTGLACVSILLVVYGEPNIVTLACDVQAKLALNVIQICPSVCLSVRDTA